MFERVYNGNVYHGTGEKVAEFIEPSDTVLEFFADMGYANVEYHVVDGRMPCAIAVITKKRTK